MKVLKLQRLLLVIFRVEVLTDRATTLWDCFCTENSAQKISLLEAILGMENTLKKLGEKFGPFDLSILECGQYNEWWNHIHMFPEQTVQAHLDLNSKVLFPVHWGKFALAYHPWQEPIERLMAKATTENVTFITPRLGELVKSENIENAQNRWWKNFING